MSMVSHLHHLGFGQDTRNLVPQSHASTKVRFLGQPIGMSFGL